MKNKLVDQIDLTFEKTAEWSITHRWLIILSSVLLLTFGLYYASKAHMDNSVNAYFDKTDPTYIAYMDYLDDFLSDEVAYIIYKAPSKEHGIFNLDVMRQIAGLGDAFLYEVPFARSVTSLADTEIIQANGDDLTIDELKINLPTSQQALLKIRDDVFMRPLYIGSLLNETGDYAAIVVDMTRTSTDTLQDITYDPEKGDGLNNLYPQVSNNKIREIISRPEYADIEFYLSGDVAMNSAYNDILGADSVYILLGTLALIVLLSLLLFRVTLIGIIGPITVVLLSIIITVGFIGFLKWEIGLFFALVPTLLSAVGVAQSVHILLEYQRALSEMGDRNAAVKAALKKVGGPCFLAAITTAAGFAVMSVSELRGIRELAVYSSVGVLITFVLSVTLLIIFLARGEHSSSKQLSINKQRRMAVNPIIHWMVRHVIAINFRSGKLIMLISFIVIGFSLIGVTKLKIDFNFLHEFKPHVEFRQHTELAEKVMGGVLNVTYIVDTKTPDGIKNKDVLHAMDKLQRFAEQQPLVKKSFSPVEIIKDLNKSFHGDDRSYYVLPEAQDLLSQYLLVYEVSGGEDLTNYVYQDFSRAVIEFRVEMTNAEKIDALIDTLDQFLIDNPIPNAEIRKTGIGLMWIKIAEYIGNTQLVSYSLVFVMVAAFMCIAFGSFKVGMLSMIPNLAPVVVTLGMMGWMNIPLDYMKLLLATIAIGIAVDDTIHLVTRFRSRFYQTGNYHSAIEKSLTDVGPALIITSIILVGAFSCYLFSNMNILASFGVLLGATITIALLADLFLMPVLLATLKPFGEEFEAKQ